MVERKLTERPGVSPCLHQCEGFFSMFRNGLTAVKKLQSLLSNKRKSAALLTLACTVALSSISAASADELKWTVTIVTHANKGIAAYNRGDYPTAKSEFRLVIG